ncbi:Ig-like domain-containing protein, partial [Yersinia enterocolitica]|uniref:Ig-like domain-containing protein n=1 Tax=Yersinia enterocolitica TaxID=630 RepID=UPI00398D486F
LTSRYTLSVPLPVLIQDDFTVTSGASADGVDSNALNAIVKDAYGNLLSGVEVTFNVTSGAATPATQTVKTNDSGVAQASLVSLVVGGNQVTATVGTHTTAAKTSSFVAGTVERSTSRLEASPVQLVANGIATSTLTFTAKDINENPVLGQVVTFGLSGATEGVVVGTTTDHNDGTYSAILKVGTKAGTVIVVPKVNDVQVGNGGSYNSRTLTFIADESTAIIDSVDFSVASGAVADGTASNALNAIVKDAYGNLLSGVEVTFNVTSGEATPATQTVKTNSSGMAQAALVSTVAGDNQVTVTSLGSTPAAKTASFVGVTLKLTADRQTITADGSDIVTYTAEVVDANDKPVKGVSVHWETSVNSLSHNSSLTNESGYATATLSGTNIGQARVTASVGKDSMSVDVEFTNKIQESWIINSTSSTHSAKPIYGVGIANVAYGFIAIPPTIGPTSLSGASFDPDIVTVPLSNEAGQQYMVKFRGYRRNACTVRSMSSSIACDGAIGTSVHLRLDYKVEDNGHLPAGFYDGVINLQGVGTEGNNRIDVSINVQLTVTADSLTAGIAEADFVVVKNNASADGVEINTVKAVVRDINGTPVPNAEVTFTANNGANIAATGTTGADGSVIVALTSTTAGSAKVTASVNDSSQSVETTFIADESTATLSGADFTVASGAVADGEASNALSARVKDAYGNPLSGVDVTFTVTEGAATPATQTVKTNGSGVAQASLVSTVAGDNRVTVTSLGSTPAAKVSTFVPGAVSMKVWIR